MELSLRSCCCIFAVVLLAAASALIVSYEVIDACAHRHSTSIWHCLRFPSAYPFGKDAELLSSAAFYTSIGAIAVALIACVCACASSAPSTAAASSFDDASIVAKLTFWWVTPTLNTALAQGKLEADDLPLLPGSDEPRRLGRIFDRVWSRGRRGPYKLLLASSFLNQKAVFLQSFVFGWAFLAAMFADPIILNALLQSMSEATHATAPPPPPPLPHHTHDPAQPPPSALPLLVRQLGLVALAASSMLVRVTCMELCYFHSKRCANNARTTLVLGVFRSTIDVHDAGAVGGGGSQPSGKPKPGHSGESDGIGKLTNLMATDADRIGRTEWLVWAFAQWTWSIIILPAVVYMMWLLLGSAAFVGIGAFLLSNSATILISNTQSALHRHRSRFHYPPFTGEQASSH